MASQTYIRSLADPFDTDVQQPKFFDGRLDRTAGLRLRTTGDITCKTTGFTYIAVGAGNSNVICWQAEGSDDVNTAAAYLNKGPPAFKNFRETSVNDGLIRQARVITAGAKFALVNGPEESDGMWEAVRFNSRFVDAVGVLATPADEINNNTHSLSNAGMLALCEDMANNPAYQTGRLRDIHRYLFRVNWRGSELAWPMNMVGGAATLHDIVVLRIRGRQISGQPSILRFDSVGTYEVEYKPNTPMFRLMQQNPPGGYSDADELLGKLNIRLPGIRIDG